MTTQEHDDHHVDAVTGIATTGHEWDGVRELNQPLPRWWLWIFYATIVWSIGYWVVYPSWPLISSFTGGLFGWHSRTAVVEELDALKARRGPMVAQLAAAPIGDVEKNAGLLDFTLAYGRVAFRENCAPCHGAGGGGAAGYPNLIDDDWLWGGTTDAIVQTVTYGARNTNDKSHQGVMPAFGRNGTLARADIETVAHYVRSLSGLDTPSAAELQAGAKIFASNCAVCHGDDGKGKRDVGSANLTDAVWLYGSSFDTIVTDLTNGRGGVMPAWGERLDATTIKALTLYVHSLGGGE
jgi:cytochrome c oxidase cbb3-type subunit 3